MKKFIQIIFIAVVLSTTSIAFAVDTISDKADCITKLPLNCPKCVLVQDLRDCVVSIWDDVENLEAVSTPTSVTTTAINTATTGNAIIHATASLTVSLHTAVGNEGNQVTVKLATGTQHQLIAIDANGSELIDDKLIYYIGQPWNAITFTSDGTGWYTTNYKGIRAVYDIREYGAQNGVDSTAAIQAAWDDMVDGGPRGAHLYIPLGTFYITDTFAPGANNGVEKIWIDDVIVLDVENADTDTILADSIRLGNQNAVTSTG